MSPHEESVPRQASLPRGQWPRLDRPRIPPVEQDAWTDAQRALLGPIADRGRLYNVHKTLANHPQLMAAWLTFATYVLRDNSLPVRDREIAILRIGYLCHAEYELAQHARIGKRAGLSDEDLRRIAEGPAAAGLAEHDRLLLAAVDELHQRLHRPGHVEWPLENLQRAANDRPGVHRR